MNALLCEKTTVNAAAVKLTCIDAKDVARRLVMVDLQCRDDFPCVIQFVV